MNLLRRIALASLLLSTVVATAAAEPSRPARARKGKAKPAATEPPKTRSLIFDEGDNVDGNRLSPDGDSMTSQQAAKHTSLIRVRVSFVPEILKSAEDL